MVISRNYTSKFYNGFISGGRPLLSVVCWLLVACSQQQGKPVQLHTSVDKIDLGSSITQATVELSSIDQAEVAWSISSDQPWLSFSPDSGNAGKKSSSVQVTADRSRISPGKHSAQINITFKGGVVTLPVRLVGVNMAPVINITAPLESARFSSREAVRFTADVSDKEDATVLHENIIWSSDVDGQLGSGKSIRRKLTAGKHVIKVAVSDSHGSENVARVNVNIVDVADDTGPVAITTAPVNKTQSGFINDGSRQTTSSMVTLKIAAADAAGIAAYAIYDVASSKDKEQSIIDTGDLRWESIDPVADFRALLSYRLENEYDSGELLTIGVVFRNTRGVSSEVVLDSVVFGSAGSAENSSQASDVPSSGVEPGRGVVSASTLGDGSLSMSQSGETQSPANHVTGSQQDDTGKHKILYAYDFEQGHNGWWVENGQWEIGEVPAGRPYQCRHGGQCAGTVLSADYADYVASRLVSPPIQLLQPHDDRRILLLFRNWYSVHLHDLTRLQISQQTAPGEWTPWKTLMTHSGSSRGWKLETVGVTNYAGKTVRFAFHLYQPEDQAGTRPGWYVDDFEVMIRP